jgi:hypothetical protein
MINNIPPKQTLSGMSGAPPEGSAGYDHLPPADPLHGGMPQHGLVLHDPSHGDANSFPVLKAFQDYLEMERQQARKRLVTLTVFFVSLMTLVVAGFIVAFIFMFNNMSRREDRLMDAALQQRRDVPPAAAATAAPAPADLMAQQMARAFQAAAQNLQTNLSSQLANVGTVATRLDSKVEAQNAEMARLRDTLAAIQKENATLRTDMPKLALEAARKAPPATLSRPSAGTAPAAATTPPAAAAGRTPKGYGETVLLIRSRDGENSIPWRTLMPD